MVDQDRYHIYLKLTIDGKSSKPFSAWTLPPFQGFQPRETLDFVILRSQEQYATREYIREEGEERSELGESPNCRPGQRILL
jgi:hypothetical protein